MNHRAESKYMFDGNLLNNLNMEVYGDVFKNPDFNYLKPGEGLVLRPLATDDYDKGFTDALAHLTRVGTVTKEDFLKRFNSIKNAGTYYPLVIEDVNANEGKGKIIATGTLTVEENFIHSCATRGRVEEICVDKNYRGKQLGKVILASVSALSKKVGVYKTTLQCTSENVPFY